MIRELFRGSLGTSAPQHQSAKPPRISRDQTLGRILAPYIWPAPPYGRGPQTVQTLVTLAWVGDGRPFVSLTARTVIYLTISQRAGSGTHQSR